MHIGIILVSVEERCGHPCCTTLSASTRGPEGWSFTSVRTRSGRVRRTCTPPTSTRTRQRSPPLSLSSPLRSSCAHYRSWRSTATPATSRSTTATCWNTARSDNTSFTRVNQNKCFLLSACLSSQMSRGVIHAYHIFVYLFFIGYHVCDWKEMLPSSTMAHVFDRIRIHFIFSLGF